MRITLLALGLLAACKTAVPEFTDAPAEDTDTVEVTTDAPRYDCEPYGVSIGESAVIDHNGVIEGLPDGPESTPTTLSLNADILCALMVRRGRVTANIRVAPGATPIFAVCRGEGGRVEGEREVLESRVGLAVPPLPPDLPGSSGALSVNDRLVLSQDQVLDSLDIGPGGELIIEGDVQMRVDGALTMNGGRISLAPASTLGLWLEGDAQLSGGASLNGSGDPAAVRLSLRGRDEVVLSEHAIVAARVRGPASEVRINGESAELIGTVQAKEVSVLWGGRIAVPPALLCE